MIWRAPRRARRGTPCRFAAMALLALGALLLAACGGPTRGAAPAAPDFALVAYQGDAVLGGHQARFADVFTQGRPVVLNFWAGDCPACQAEMPACQRVADQERGRVIVVGLDVGTFTALGSHDSARQLMADLCVTYPTAYAVDASPLQRYNVRSMPTTVFLTARGRVVARADGMMTESQLRGAVQRLVAAAP